VRSWRNSNAFARAATPVTGHLWGGSPDADACKAQPHCSLPPPTPALAPSRGLVSRKAGK